MVKQVQNLFSYSTICWSVLLLLVYGFESNANSLDKTSDGLKFAPAPAPVETTTDRAMISGVVSFDAPVADQGFPLLDWSVTLLNHRGIPQATVQTGKQGKYSFTELEPGVYRIALNPPEGYRETSDFDGVSSKDFAEVELSAEQQLNQVNFTYTGTASIESFLWNDKNMNGLRDKSEKGWAGLEVRLEMKNTTYQLTTTTDASGTYHFKQLPPGDYTLSAYGPEGFECRHSKNRAAKNISRHNLTIEPNTELNEANFCFRKPVKSAQKVVELEYLNGQFMEERSVEISWITSEETYCERFEIQRSINKNDWTVIGKIEADGKAEQKMKYRFIDRDPPCRKAYYRIHQIDFDRSRGTSDILRMRPGCAMDKYFFRIPSSWAHTPVDKK